MQMYFCLSLIYVLCACVRVFEEMGLLRDSTACPASQGRLGVTSLGIHFSLITLANRSLSFVQ